jgi:hypothetical protein
MATTAGIRVILGIVLIFLLVFVIWVLTSFYITNAPGMYDYTIDIRGLDRFQAGPVTTIILPLPVRNGQQVFPDEQLQNQTFGAWTSGIVRTPQGKMLGFQSSSRNLSDLHAEFARTLLEKGKIKNITRDSFYPALPYNASPYTQWVYGFGAIRNYTTVVSVPDSLQPLNGGNDTISIIIELIATGGVINSSADTTYRVSIDENLPPDARDMTNVTAQIGILVKNQSSEEIWAPFS